MLKPLGLLIMASVILSGCKAEKVDLMLSDREIRKAIDGEATTAKFSADFKLLSKLDDRTKSQMDSVEKIVEQTMDIEDFEVSRGKYNVRIQLEGRIPVIFAQNDEPVQSESPWAVVVRNANFDWLPKHNFKVRIEPTNSFQTLKSRLATVNFMLVPDQFHPLRVRFRNRSQNKISVIAPGVEHDGEAHALLQKTVTKRQSFGYRGGVYNSTAPTMFLRLD